MIGSTIAGFVLVGVMATFTFLVRSGLKLQDYNDMESQARKALEYFAEDVRQASAITWASTTSLTLTVNSASIVYSYSDTDNTFYRQTASGTKALVTGITAFQFKAFKITGVEITSFGTSAALTSAGQLTKQLQISLEAGRSNRSVVAATNTVLSARFILRNKIVTA